MDVRDWNFLARRLAELSSITRELSGTSAAARIGYTAFFWTLLQYAQSADDAQFRQGAMSLPDVLTPANRVRIEALCRELDVWMQSQNPDEHPRYADLRQVVDVGLQATTHPIFGP